MFARRFPLAALALLMTAGLSFPSLATPPFGHGEGPGLHGRGLGDPPPPMIDALAERLGLDEATREAIHEIADRSRAEGRELRRELRKARLELRDLLAQDAPDEAAVMSLAERMGQLETRARKHRLGAMLQIRAHLTAEQRAELVEIRKEHHSKRLKRRRHCNDDSD